MSKSKFRAVQYLREFEGKAGEVQPDGSTALRFDSEKFGDLLQMTEEKKGKADAVLVYCPEVLGDTYEEMVMNLEVIAEAGMAVMIIPMSQRKGDKVVKVDVERPPKTILVLREGGPKGAAIYTSAPDETYAQAELLLLAEKSENDPKYAGMRLIGFYDVVGTRDEMPRWLKSYRKRPDDRKRLEEIREEILRDGWHAALSARSAQYVENDEGLGYDGGRLSE